MSNYYLHPANEIMSVVTCTLYLSSKTILTLQLISSRRAVCVVFMYVCASVCVYVSICMYKVCMWCMYVR